MSAEVVCMSPVAPRATPASGVTDQLYRMFLATPIEPSTPPSPASKLVAPTPVTPTPTGCNQNGVTRSVVVIAGVDGSLARLRAAMKRTSYVSSLAKRNGNRMSYVFLGGALPPESSRDEGVLHELLNLRRHGSEELGVKPGDVHLIVGAREMQALATLAEGPREEGPLWEYLRNSAFVECLGPQGMLETGRRGIWLKAMSTSGVVGKLPGVGVAGADGGVRAEWIPPGKPLALIPWKDEVNRRWSEATADPWTCKSEDGTKHRYAFWLALAKGSLRERERAFQHPAARLTNCDDGSPCDSIAVFARETAAFGAVRRSFTVDGENRLQLSGQQWLDVGADSDSIFWASLSYCGSTKRALAAAHRPPTLDRTVDADELQRDVNVTLSSLVQHERRAQDALALPERPYAVTERLVGQVGPVVLAGRENDEAMRVVQFSMPGADDVLMLLPELYLQLALSRFNQEADTPFARGARAVAGFLVLRDEDAIQLVVPDVSASEQPEAAKQMGVRLWRLPQRTGRTAAMAEAIAKAGNTQAGSAIAAPPGATIFHTATDATDPLAGIRVKWTFAPGGAGRDLPTLVVF